MIPLSIAIQITDILNKGFSAEDTTDRIMSDLRNTPDLLDLVRPLVYEKTKQILRMRTRDAEDQVFDGDTSEPTPITNGFTPLVPGDQGARINGSTFAILRCPEYPEGADPTWDEATPDQHRLRAVQQIHRAAATRRDAMRHIAAADLIDATPGASCLAEIPDWEKAVQPFLDRATLSIAEHA